MKTVGTLFSGGELFGVGAKMAGYEHAWGIEYDDKIAAVARLNGFNVLTGDVRHVDDYKHLPEVDHLHASPPCPNFSVAKTNGGETEMDIALADAVCWFIRWKNPKTITLENVMAYRKSKSLKRIVSTLEELGFFIDIQNLNAADFGVPQTRRRMILRASRSLLRPYPQPVKWVGWYEAIEGLIDTLPETEFAPWQMERLPQEYRNFLMRTKRWGPEERGTSYIFEDRPSPTVIVSESSPKAFLMESKFPGRNGKKFHKEPKEPVPTVTALDPNLKAFIVNTKDPHGESQRFTVPHSEAPMYTVLASATEARTKAFVVAGGSAGKNVPISDEEEPIFTIKANAGGREPVRAYEKGRVVKMTIQALGRFQSVPDWYQGLTTKINGNGVPCLMAKGVMETFDD